MLRTKTSFFGNVVSFYYKDLETLYNLAKGQSSSFSGLITLKVDKKFKCYKCVKTLVYSYDEREKGIISSFIEQNQIDFYMTLHLDFRAIGKCMVLLLQEENVNAYFYRNEEKFYLPSTTISLKDNELEIPSFCFDFKNGCPISSQSKQYLETYKKYHELEIKKLQEKQDNTYVEIDRIFFTSYQQYFRMLGVDNTLVVPIRSKTQKYKKILLKITRGGKDDMITFSKVSTSTLSLEEFNLYNDQLLDDDIELEKGMNLLLLTFEEDDLDKAKFISEVLDISNQKVCIFQDNQGEIAQLKKIVRAIDQILSGAFANPKLVNLICSNDITEYYQQQKPFTFDIQESVLYNKYPNLKNNIEQCICVEKILQMESKELPLMLVQGPPGTGKTELILTVIRELSKQKKNVLISSNVHVACNNIIERSKNDKELIIKRYSSLHDKVKYQEELSENQTRYIKNQVLEGYKYNGTLIESKYHMLDLEAKIKQSNDELSILEADLKKFQIKNSKHLEYRNRLEILKNSINEAECEIERHVDRKIDLLNQHHTINEEKVPIEKDIQLIDQNIEDLKIKKLGLTQQIADYDEQITLENKECERNINELEAFIAYISKYETLIDEYHNTQNNLVEEISLLKNLNIVDLRKSIVNINDGQYDTIIKKYFMSEYVNLMRLEKLYKMIERDVSTANIEKLNKSVIEELYYNITNIYKVDDNFIQSIEDLHHYYGLHTIRKLSVHLGFNSNTTPKTLKANKTRLIDTCKRIYYSNQVFIEEILKNMDEQRLNDVIQENQNKIKECKNMITKINLDKRNEAKTIHEFNESRRSCDDKIQDINRDKKKIAAKLAYEVMCQQKEEEKKAIENQKIEDLNLKLTGIVNNVNSIDNDIFNLEKGINDLNKKTKEIQDKISVLYFQNGDKKNNIELEYNLMASRITTVKKDQEYLSDALSNINSKLNEFEEHDERTQNLLFEYANELAELSKKSAAEVVDAMSCNSKAFTSMFENTNHAEGSVVSMTTSQISQYFSKVNDFNFDYVIIDEASKCNFQDLVISLPNTKHLVLIGDYMQLESQTEHYSSLSDSVKSIFTKEIEWNMMNVSPFSSLLQQILKVHIDQKSTVNELDSTLSVLKRQYRMNKGIFDLVSPVYSIYKGFSIIDEKNTSSNDLLVMQVSGNEEGEEQYKNNDEIIAVSSMIKCLYENKKEINNINTIGIITGYRRQANELNRAVKKLKLSNHFKIEIGTIDRFQGKEFDLVILSMVRTKKIGFLKEIRRMNVAVSRAKKHLVIAGNFAELNQIAQKELEWHNKAVNHRYGKKNPAHVLNHETRYVLKYMIPSLFDNRSIFLSNDESGKHIVGMIKENNNATNNIF